MQPAETSEQAADVDAAADVNAAASRKRVFSVSSGQSAEQYMSQLLSQKRLRMNSDDHSSRGSSEDGGHTRESSEGGGNSPEADDDSSESDDDHGSASSNALRPGHRAGSILRLTLKNFMCHDHFELSFGPHMNFIIGRNGSGKSAVLTGISVGLGAKALDTSRASSMKSLIKDGKSMSRIVVALDNDGLDAFEPEVYGKVIYVERKLNREGTNLYSIKSENGTVVSVKKKTLDEILQRFFIVVNNPLSFLSQDKAREFIANSTELSRFTHFSEGTNIQSIIQNYQEASRSILALQSRLVAAKKYLEEACRKYAECEKSYLKYKDSHNLRQRLEKIHGKIHWFNVEVLERRIAKRSAEIAANMQEVSDCRRGIEECTKKVEQAREELADLNQLKSAFQQEVVTKEEDLMKAEELYNDSAKRIQSVRADLQSYKAEIEEFGDQIKKHHESIVREQAKIDDANGGSKDLMAQRLKALQTRHQTLLTERNEAQSLLQTFERMSPEMEALKREAAEQTALVNLLREKLRNLERTKNDAYAAFGLNINHLMRVVATESAWHQKPIGPIGYYVSVKPDYSHWKDLINATLQRTLDSFVVCDEHDRKILNQHMRDKKIYKSIIVRKFEQFEYKKNANFTTLLDTLEIHHSDVLYTLIDSAGVEEIVVCDSISQAESVTRDGSVKMAFCVNDRRSGIRMSRRDGHLSRDPVFYPKELLKLAGKVSGDSINTELDEALRLENSMQQKQYKLREEEHAKKIHAQKNLARKKEYLTEIGNQIFTLEQALSDEGDYGKIESLRAQIEQCENRVKTRQGMSAELLNNHEENKKNFRILKDRFQAAQNDKDRAVRELSQCEERISKSSEGEQLALAEADRLEAKIRDLQQEVQRLEAKKMKDIERQRDIRSEAEELCSRSDIIIEETDSTESITDEFRKLQEQINEREKTNTRTFEDIQKEVMDSKALKEKCEQSVLEVEHARITLENDLNARFENLNITIKEKLTRAKLSFEQSLALRGFKGKLEFDFAKKRVVTEVQTKDDKDTRAVLSLSGGEKSFTQIAFLLSIWKVMKPRVCGLDEFDVFMDSVNRTIAIRLLIHELRSSMAQSIFITPQDIAVVGDLKDSEDVRIHRINAPRTD